MLEQLDDIRAKAAQLESTQDGQDHLFSGVEHESTQLYDTFRQLAEYPKAELLSFEKEMLGLYITDHPLSKALDYVTTRASRQVRDLEPTVHRDQVFLE
jgi:DNA polymerase III alpha subunit